MKNAEFRIIQLLIFLILPIAVLPQDSIPVKKNIPVRVNGYVKDMQSFFFTDQPGSLISGNLIHNRINMRWDICKHLYTRVEMRNRLFFGEQVKLTNGFGKQIDTDNGIIDLSYNVLDDTAVVLNTLLDRLLVNWSKDKWEVTLGRQRINWGINTVWNPNDIFNAYNYFDFDYEERPGTDALRVQYYSGQVSSFEIAGKIARGSDKQAAAFMYRTNYKGYDMQFFSGLMNLDLVAGGGWAGNLGQSGFKGELSYFHPRTRFVDTTGSLSFSMTVDRTFKKGYFAMASYLYNSYGKSLAGNVAGLGTANLSAKSLMPFEHSFFAQAGKAVSPLISASMGMIYSPTNNSIIALPVVTGSLSNNWELAFIAQSFFAENSGVYKTLGNGVFLRLRYSY